MRSCTDRGARSAVLAVVAVLLAAPASACDLCAVYSATDVSDRTFSLGVAEQFTRFATLQDGGEEVDNPAHERIESSITQIFGAYRIRPWLGVQLTLPVITKSFRRLTATGIENGDETGVGDMTLFASVEPYTYVDGESVIHLSGILGVKMPTGDSDRLSEELEEEDEHEDPSDDPWFPRRVRAQRLDEDGGSGQHVPGDVPSGVHGHDLALGTGSADVLLGAETFAAWRRFYAGGGIQYVIRTEGSFGYQYANDLIWHFGPGYFALLDDNYSLGVQALASGEAKGKDTLDGERLDDTAITAVYMGPALRATWKDRLTAEVGIDLPLLQNNSSLQIVPDYRIRGGVSWHF